MGLDGVKTKLVKADINKVDFVPAGAQQHSRISLFKSEQGIISKLTEAIAKAMNGFKVIPIDEEVEDGVEDGEEDMEKKKCGVKKGHEAMLDVLDHTDTFYQCIESIVKSNDENKTKLMEEAVDEFGVAVSSSVMKIGKKISTQRMDALKALMVQLASLIADAETEPAVVHNTEQGVAQPASQPAPDKGEKEGTGQIKDPAGKETNPKATKPKNTEGSGKQMAEINKSALPQDVQDYITELESKVVIKEEPKKTEEEILKSLPESVAKMLQDQKAALNSANEQIAKMKDESDEKVFVAKAAELTSNLGVDSAEFGTVLKSINAASPELSAKIEAVLKAANEAVAKGDLFKEAGTDGGTAGISKSDAWVQIETMADQSVEKGEHKTKAEAIAKAMQTPEGRRLYAIYTGKIRG